MQILAEGHRKSLLDPRTKLFLLFTITLVVVGGRHNALMAAPRILLTLIPFLLMLFEHRAGMAFSYAVLYAAAWCGSRMLVPVMHGFWGFLVLAFTGIISMMLPGFAIGAYLVSTTTVSEFMKAMERMRIPEKITIPLSVMFRFFPTVAEEYSDIGDAMKMRGVRLAGGKPLDMLEYRLVPLLISSVKIGDELSAAALTRGLGKPVKRTNMATVGMGPFDVICFLIGIGSLICFMVDLVWRII